MNIDNVASLINDGRWVDASVALEALVTQEGNSDKAYILAASICEHNGDREGMFDSIRSGLALNHNNYELYVMLGNYYYQTNINKAYLCYENALFYCDNKEDMEYIDGMLSELKKQATVNPCSIVIVSYNNSAMLKDCINTIRVTNMPSTYELIVVDNASTDGVQDWLLEQKDMVVICNKDNKGFGGGCNQGIKAAAQNNDIFLLNNDTIVFPNSIFWLRMGLYEDDTVGATGSVSNYVANGQMIDAQLRSIDDCLTFAKANNIPGNNVLERKVWLSGFAMMIKRCALDTVGLFDTRYGNGYYEDNDLGVRLQYAGYKTLVCRNSFIYHYGSQSFGKEQEQKLISINKDVFKQKWGFDISYYTYARNEIVELITHNYDAPIRVLEIGCGCGATLNRIKYLYPASDVRGIEIVPDVAKLGSNNVNIVQGDIQNMQLDYEEGYFDYIIFADVLEHLYYPEEVLKRLKKYLSKDGKILMSIPNIMHASVLVPLIKGEFNYKDSGILDKTHIRFFTRQSIEVMLNQTGFDIETISGIADEEQVFEEEKDSLEKIYEIAGPQNKNLFRVYQYIIKAKQH